MPRSPSVFAGSAAASLRGVSLAAFVAARLASGARFRDAASGRAFLRRVAVVSRPSPFPVACGGPSRRGMRSWGRS